MKARLIYQSTAASGAVLKTKGNHMTSPFLRICYMAIYYDNLPVSSGLPVLQVQHMWAACMVQVGLMQVVLL